MWDIIIALVFVYPALGGAGLPTAFWWKCESTSTSATRGTPCAVGL